MHVQRFHLKRGLFSTLLIGQLSLLRHREIVIVRVDDLVHYRSVVIEIAFDAAFELVLKND